MSRQLCAFIVLQIDASRHYAISIGEFSRRADLVGVRFNGHNSVNLDLDIHTEIIESFQSGDNYQRRNFAIFAKFILT